jgi:toxin ParE1/3/4
MTKFRVKVLALAERDLLRIWRNIAEYDDLIADRFLLTLGERISSLYEFPDRGAARFEIGKGVRILIEGKYLIIYRKLDSGVEVLRVVHGARDLGDLYLT